MKIVIFGASGAGTSTLAASLAEAIQYTYLDADDYYWAKTKIPFELKIPKAVRNENLKIDFLSNKNVIVVGSLMTWSDYWNGAFDLAIFLAIPHDIRIERLISREKERYGDLLITDQFHKQKSKDFIDWARKYDDDTFDGKSYRLHEKWMRLLTCHCVRIEGDTTNSERINLVLTEISKLS